MTSDGTCERGGVRACGGERGRGRAIAPLFALLTLLPLLTAGCNALQLGQPLRLGDDAWTTAGGSNQRTNATDASLPLPLTQVWRYDAAAAFGPAPAVAAGGTLVVVTKKGEAHAVDVETGRRLAVGDLKAPIAGAPVLTERTLFAALAEGKRTVAAYDLANGARRWAVEAGPHEAGLLLAGGTLVAAGLDGTVRGIEPGRGEVRWTATPDSTAGFFAAPVALSDARLAVADDRGRITALDLATGALAWTADAGAPVYETPAAGAGLLVVPTTRGRLVALDATTGAEHWALQLDDATVRFAAPAIASDAVLVGASDGSLRALDVATGAERWRFVADGNVAAAPLVAGESVFVGTMGERLYALDLATGTVRWESELEGRVKSEPILHGGLLLVPAEPLHVYAFAPNTSGDLTSRVP